MIFLVFLMGHFLISNFFYSPFFNTLEDTERPPFEEYLQSIYNTKDFHSICEEQENQKACNHVFKKITKKEIKLQQSFLEKSKGRIFLQGNKEIESWFSTLPNSEQTKTLYTIPGDISYYSFISGFLKVKGKFLLQDSISVFSRCDNGNGECIRHFPKVFHLVFLVEESDTPEFLTGSFLGVGCLDTEHKMLFADYEIVDLSTRTYSLSYFRFPEAFTAQILEALQDGNSRSFELFVAPNSEYVQGDMICQNRYFLNPSL